MLEIAGPVVKRTRLICIVGKGDRMDGLTLDSRKAHEDARGLVARTILEKKPAKFGIERLLCRLQADGVRVVPLCGLSIASTTAELRQQLDTRRVAVEASLDRLHYCVDVVPTFSKLAERRFEVGDWRELEG